jgi:hypothetical protein
MGSSFSPMPVSTYNCRGDEHPASGGHECFVLDLDRGPCSGDVALDRLGEPSAQTSLGLGRAVRKAIELIKQAFSQLCVRMFATFRQVQAFLARPHPEIYDIVASHITFVFSAAWIAMSNHFVRTGICICF